MRYLYDISNLDAFLMKRNTFYFDSMVNSARDRLVALVDDFGESHALLDQWRQLVEAKHNQRVTFLRTEHELNDSTELQL